MFTIESDIYKKQYSSCINVVLIIYAEFSVDQHSNAAYDDAIEEDPPVFDEVVDPKGETFNLITFGLPFDFSCMATNRIEVDLIYD